MRYNTYNVRMFPPVSDGTLTLLDPDVMRKYNEEYNRLAEDKYADVTNIKTPDLTIYPSTTRVIKDYFGCG